MCNLYRSTPRDVINMRHLVTLPLTPYPEIIAPLVPAPIVMAGGVSAVAQWGMIPPSSPTRKPMRTVKPPVEVFRHGAADPVKQVELPL